MQATTVPGSLKDWGQSLLQLFFPRLCEGCNNALLKEEEVLCISCSAQLPRTEYHDDPKNDTVLRLAGRLPFQHASSFAYFTMDGLLQHLIHGLKYRDKQEIGIFLGRQLAFDLRACAWIKQTDLLIPVPLHPKKEAHRGYNQSLLIAEGMSDILNIPIADTHLLRSRHTDSQTKKSRTERVDNMQNVFVIRREAELQGRHVLLIDDVLTTGATLEACGNILLTVPGLKLSVCTVGIAST